MVDINQSSPTSVVPPRPHKPTTWPMVIGIISIVIGVGGLFMYGCFSPVAIFGTLAMRDKMEAAGATAPGLEMQKDMFDAIEAYLPLTLANYAVYAVLGVLLLVTGVAMIRRRPVARPLALNWAWLKIVASGFGAVVGWITQKANVQAIASPDGTGAMSAGMGSMMEAFAIAAVVGTLLFALALPVFMLVWFTRRTIREEVRGWRAEASAGA